MLSGHNNTIVISCNVANVAITGHNNKLYYNGSQSPPSAYIGRLVISGHNNRVEKIQAQILSISGHNNSIIQVQYVDLADQGMTNKFYNCSQMNDD